MFCTTSKISIVCLAIYTDLVTLVLKIFIGFWKIMKLKNICGGGSRVLREWIIKYFKNDDQQMQTNFQISKVNMVILGLFPGNLVLLVNFDYCWFWCFLYTLGIYSQCSTYGETGLLICTNKNVWKTPLEEWHFK